MPNMTLSETAQLTKKIMVYAAIAVVIIGAIWGGIAFYLANRKVEVYIPPPTKGFGILPKPPLPKTKLTASSVTYDLDTETGSLPIGLPDRMKVYPVIKPGVTFATPERARRIANGYSFKNGPQIISPTVHKFTDNKGGEMIFDLESMNFRFKRPVASRSAEFDDAQNETMEDATRLENNFKKYLRDQGTLPAEIGDGEAKIFYNRNRPEEATEAAITIWQTDITETIDETNKLSYPIVTPDFREGLVRGVVTKWQSFENKYLSLDYIYWQIDTERFETYPIKTVEEAFAQLESGEGVTVLPYSRSTVAIENVYLAYLLPKEYTPYLQPVYVFQGPEFAAYVPAIPSDNFAP